MVLKKGCKGKEVRALQFIVGEDADGIFGSKTRDAVKKWQKEHGLAVDGIAGELTLRSIVAVAPLMKKGDRDTKWVCAIECLIDDMVVDGILTDAEDKLIKTFQKANGLTADGKVGILTWSKLWSVGTSNASAAFTSVVNYKQYDSRWKSNVYTSCGNKSQNMGNSGCGPTAAADVVATVKDSSVNPWTLAQLYMKNGFRTKDQGTSWSAFKWTANRFGFSDLVETKSFATMKTCLQKGGLVVVSFAPSKWTKAGHFCCLWKIDDKYVYVNDPASSSSSRAKGTYKEVQDAAKQYFCFYP